MLLISVIFLLFELATCTLWPKGIVHYSINPKHYDPHSQDVMIGTFRKIQSEVCVKFFNMPANHTADSQRVLYIHNPNREKLCPPRSYDFNRTVVDMTIGYKCVNEKDISRMVVEMLKASIQKSEPIVNSQDLLKKFQEKSENINQSVLSGKDRNYINVNYFKECGGLGQRSVPSRRQQGDGDPDSSGLTAANREYYRSKVWPMAIVVYKVNPKLKKSQDFETVLRAMRIIETEPTEVVFQEADDDDVLKARNMIVFEEEGADWPNLGFQEGIQVLKLSSIARCEDPGHSSHALMMMMRILGLPMMSNRYDRDNYVKIHWKNVQKGEELYLEKAPEAAWLKSIPYDFTSVTHAPANFLCPGCLTTYTVEPVQDHLWHRTLQMGHPTKLSPDDVNLIRVVYAEERTSILKPNVPQPTEKSEADDKEYDGEDEINEPDESVTRRTDVDNSQYVKGESRYIWFPDGNRMPSLVDLQAPIPAANGTASPNVYLLFTRSNPVNPQVIEIENASTASNSNYDAKKPLVVIVHGWMSDRHSEINVLVRDAFLEAHDVNVIILDWTKKAGKLYTIAMSAVPRVGRSLAEFLTWLIETSGGDWNKVHLVGFSLGAHVVGKAGKITGGKPARVTVLDPAGPLWDGKEARDTISVAGQYVEAIHTNGDALGLYQKVAHADFYPNGGKIQPGCDCIDSHCRAYELFAATVRKNHLVGYSCDDMKQALEVQCSGSALNMGNGNFYKRGNGIYGLKTDKKWPY
ncbi:uncharacterized protein LOC128682283 isoform X2 [Plodia interpunctella]|uniref:uncharacterized protein LOC128682283 isoform X2 n=1 Tax=Plodia interpunctella TaxID=58824 RepID=UPI002367B374|nr:uncharacterized protein LOC128682283 isoform X2 [Plodia interpunctella]